MEYITNFDNFYNSKASEIKKDTIKHIFLVDGDKYDYRFEDLFAFYDHSATKYDFHLILLYKNENKILNSKFGGLKAISIVSIPKDENTRVYIFKLRNKLKSNNTNIILIHKSKVGPNTRRNNIICKITGPYRTRIKKHSMFSFYFVNQKTQKLINGLRKESLMEYKTITSKISNFKIWSNLVVHLLEENRSSTYSIDKNAILDEIRPHIAFLVLLHKYFDFRSKQPDKIVKFEKKYNLCDNYVMKWLSSGNFYYLHDCIKMKCEIIGPRLLWVIKNTINGVNGYLCGDGMYQTNNNNNIYFYIYKKVKNSYVRIDSRSCRECDNILEKLTEILSSFGKIKFGFCMMPKNELLDISFSNWRVIRKNNMK